MRTTKLCYLALCFFLSHQLASQSEFDAKKQAIYANVGSVIFENQASVTFERALFITATDLQTRLKLTAGKFLTNNYDYDEDAEINSHYFSASIVQLIPLGVLHLELNLGVANTYFTTLTDPLQQDSIRTYSLAGLRYSRDAFLIRAGLGNLELLHLGIGFQF